MKEKKQTIIFVAVGVIVLVGVFILSNVLNKSYIQEITYEEYTKLKDEENKNYVYTGDLTTSIKSELNSYGKNNDTVIYHIDPSKLTKDQKEELGYTNDNFTIYENNEETKHEVKLINITVDEYLKLIKEKGFHFMFIGSKTCGYCTKFKEEISKAQLFHDFDIYYLDLYEVDEKSLNKLYESDDYFTTEQWGTPLNFLYKDGEKLGTIPGYVTSDELIKFLSDYSVIKEK